MKRYLTKICLASLLSLAACSSIEVDDSEIIAENYPAGFNVSEYTEINPELAVVQIKNLITSRNIQFSTEYRKQNGSAYDVIADNKALFTDSASVAAFFSEFAGYSPALWDNVAALSTEAKSRILEFNSLGVLDPQEDLAIARNLLTTSVDSSIIALQYPYVGWKEGRPYRYCLDTDPKTTERNPADERQAVLSTSGVPNYYPNTYCFDQATGKIFWIEQ